MKWNVALVLVGFSAVALAGCSSAKPEKPEPREYTSVPLYMAGQEIPADSQEKYLTNASIKMYSVGRLVDPAPEPCAKPEPSTGSKPRPSGI